MTSYPAATVVVVDLSNQVRIYRGGDFDVLQFGMCPEEVNEVVGPAAQVKYLERAYVYTYFSLGMDLMFSTASHGLVRLTLHTNFPEHVLFKEYNRCFFEIRAEGTSNTLNPSVDMGRRAGVYG
jgi:hypothetical protein